MQVRGPALAAAGLALAGCALVSGLGDLVVDDDAFRDGGGEDATTTDGGRADARPDASGDVSVSPPDAGVDAGYCGRQDASYCLDFDAVDLDASLVDAVATVGATADGGIAFVTDGATSPPRAVTATRRANTSDLSIVNVVTSVPVGVRAVRCDFDFMSETDVTGHDVSILGISLYVQPAPGDTGSDTLSFIYDLTPGGGALLQYNGLSAGVLGDGHNEALSVGLEKGTWQRLGVDIDSTTGVIVVTVDDAEIDRWTVGSTFVPDMYTAAFGTAAFSTNTPAVASAYTIRFDSIVCRWR